MKISTKFILVTVAFATPAFLFGRIIWPDAPTAPIINDDQMIAFVILAIAEALTFGIGIAFAIFGWNLVKKAHDKKAALILYLALIWLTVSWYPHGNFHRMIGEEVNGLLAIEYSFHLTSYIVAILAMWAFVRLIKKED